MRRFAHSCVVIGLTLILCADAAPAQQGWGTIKGQVTWQGPIPPPRAINNPNIPPQCCAKGPLVSNELVIDPKTRGVKDVLIWLDEPAGGALPIHPNLKAIPKQEVVIDQPTCAFEPRTVAIRAGQDLVIKNTAAIAHNANFSGTANQGANQLIQPGGKLVFAGAKALRAERKPMALACNIHGWMGGRIGVFDHPYFAVTDKDGNFEIKDAPAGNYVIKISHELGGWLHNGRSSKGEKIAIPARAVLELKPVTLKAGDLKK